MFVDLFGEEGQAPGCSGSRSSPWAVRQLREISVKGIFRADEAVDAGQSVRRSGVAYAVYPPGGRDRLSWLPWGALTPGVQGKPAAREEVSRKKVGVFKKKCGFIKESWVFHKKVRLKKIFFARKNRGLEKEKKVG